jgi:hypothetical protein
MLGMLVVEAVAGRSPYVVTLAESRSRIFPSSRFASSSWCGPCGRLLAK